MMIICKSHISALIISEYTIYPHLCRISTSVPQDISRLVVNMHDKNEEHDNITTDIWFLLGLFMLQ